ncbi:hypothetical protein NDU88_004065 [Pleurodeles waltl]|uniref:Uncharacterized protein n=1 Tax=Pleurodeles waltl TaxID=8319 RepID=A0AAV7KXB0_PLEWA|nr:hypothetical protein NDU88_004065 [Pleurodeles waltl]
MEARGSPEDRQTTGQEWAVRSGQSAAEWTKVWSGGGRLRISERRTGLLVLGLGPGRGPFEFRVAGLIERSLLGVPRSPESGIPAGGRCTTASHG